MTVDELIQRLQQLSDGGYGGFQVTRWDRGDDVFEDVSKAVFREAFWSRDGIESVGLE